MTTPPKLLTGGNPQIPKGDGDGPVHAYLAAMPGWKQSIGYWVDDIVRTTVPHLRTAVRWNSPLYGTEELGWFLGMHCLTKYVKVTFFSGALLHLPPPVAFKDPNARAFHMFKDTALDAEQFAAWTLEASQIPGWKIAE